MSDVQDPIQQFADEAARFEGWARLGADRGEARARQALIRITSLYLAALDLPPLPDDGFDEEVEDPVPEAERRAVAEATTRLPLDYYGVVYDPLVVPPEEPVIGSLADDVGDIYRDVVTGLRHYQAGRRQEAVWEWSFQFRHHWGEHAAQAIGALHAWLGTNAPERFSARDGERTAGGDPGESETGPRR